MRPGARGGRPLRRAARALVGTRPGGGRAGPRRSRRRSPRSRIASTGWPTAAGPTTSGACHERPDRAARPRATGMSTPLRSASTDSAGWAAALRAGWGRARHRVRPRQRDRGWGRSPARTCSSSTPSMGGGRGRCTPTTARFVSTAARRVVGRSPSPGEVPWRDPASTSCWSARASSGPPALAPYFARGVKKVIVAAPVKDGARSTSSSASTTTCYDPAEHHIADRGVVHDELPRSRRQGHPRRHRHPARRHHDDPRHHEHPDGRRRPHKDLAARAPPACR